MNINVQMNPGFKEVDRSRKRYIVMKGSAGSGKSVDTAQNYILRLMQDPGRNLLCVRKADVTNRDSTFAELQGAIFRMFGEQYKRYWHINSSNMIMECKINRNQIIFRGYIDTYSMVYTNLIAVITHELQLEKERRSNLEIEVADLRSELESMRDNISGDTN